jgi:hypothetical protein
MPPEPMKGSMGCANVERGTLMTNAIIATIDLTYSICLMIVGRVMNPVEDDRVVYATDTSIESMEQTTRGAPEAELNCQKAL